MLKRVMSLFFAARCGLVVQSLLLILLFVADCGAAAQGWSRLADLSQGRMGAIMGTLQGAYAERNYPAATLLWFNNSSDLVAALTAGKVDVALVDAISGQAILRSHPALAVLEGGFMSYPLGIGFRSDHQALRQRFDQFLERIRADGRYAEISGRWFVDDPQQATMAGVTSTSEPAAVTTLPRRVVGVAVADLPYVSFKDGRYVGFDIELLQHFAADEGVSLHIEALDFGALIPALVAGKVDMIADGIAITPERSRAVDFSAPYAHGQGVALVLRRHLASPAATMAEDGAVAPLSGHALPQPESASHTVASDRWSSRLLASLHANIVVEKRWQLVVDGLWVTLLLSIAATLFGSVLGAGVCALRMSDNPILCAVGRSYIFIIRGLPVLLLLMLIFYVVFGSININPTLVAVLAFGMNFAAYVAEMFRSAIASVDPGQAEAGIALGFSRRQSFRRIVLPQAIRHILPVYRGEFISLVKMTSIVGYIGVQDLTRAGDIIRSRTFEAFFPLVMVAVFYFFIIWLLGLALDYLDRRTDPRAGQPAGGGHD